MATLAEWDDGALPVRLGGNFELGSFDNIWPNNWINIDHNGVGPAQLRWEFDLPQDVITVRAYIRTPPWWPTATNRFISILGEGPTNHLTSFSFAGESNGGQLRIVSGSSSNFVAMSPTRLLQVSRWYRFTLQINYTNQTVRGRVWHLHNPDNQSLWDSGVVATEWPTNTRGRILTIGSVQGSLLMGHLRMAHMRCTDTPAIVTRHTSDNYPWSPPEGDYSQVRLVQDGLLVSPHSIRLWDYNGQLVPAVSAVYSGEVVEPDPEPEPEGSIIHTQTFESQTHGQSVELSAPWLELGGTSNTTPFLASTAAARHGSLGARVTNISGWRAIIYDVPMDVSGSLVRCFDWWVNIRASTTHVWLFRTSNRETTLRRNNDGTVRMQNDNAAVDVSSGIMSNNVWYRISHRVAATGQTTRIYELGDPEPFIELSGPLTTPTWDDARFGVPAAADGTSMDIDTIRIGDEWLAPN